MGQAQQYPTQSGLASAIWPEVAEGTSPRNEEFDIVHGDVLTEPFGEAVGFDGPLPIDRPGVTACVQRGGVHPLDVAPMTIVPTDDGESPWCGYVQSTHERELSCNAS